MSVALHSKLYKKLDSMIKYMVLFLTCSYRDNYCLNMCQRHRSMDDHTRLWQGYLLGMDVLYIHTEYEYIH